MPITFKQGFNLIDFDLVSKWLKEAYWSPGITRDEVVLEGQEFQSGGRRFRRIGKQVSFLRIISDKVRFAYILDVIVDPTRRRQGIGTAMVKYAMEHRKCPWSTCGYSEPGTPTVCMPNWVLAFSPILDQWMVIQNPRGDRLQFQAP